MKITQPTEVELAAFNQQRDKDGKFASTGGGGSIAGAPGTTSSRSATMETKSGFSGFSPDTGVRHAEVRFIEERAPKFSSRELALSAAARSYAAPPTARPQRNGMTMTRPTQQRSHVQWVVKHDRSPYLLVKPADAVILEEHANYKIVKG